jgi:enoyl-CoA hydratase/carnithine racemase
MQDDLVLREDRGAVTHLTLNNPGRLNALSDAMIAALSARFQEMMDSPSQRVIVLNGAGKAFCAGHDLNEMRDKRAGPDAGAVALHDLFNRKAMSMHRKN